MIQDYVLIRNGVLPEVLEDWHFVAEDMHSRLLEENAQVCYLPFLPNKLKDVSFQYAKDMQPLLGWNNLAKLAGHYSYLRQDEILKEPTKLLSKVHSDKPPVVAVIVGLSDPLDYSGGDLIVTKGTKASWLKIITGDVLIFDPTKVIVESLGIKSGVRKILLCLYCNSI